MIIHELIKMTTLGPFHAETDATVQCDDGFEIANCQTGMGEAHDVAAARMFAHCCNNYMKALEAVDAMYTKIATGASSTNEECLAWAKLIHEMEKVQNE